MLGGAARVKPTTEIGPEPVRLIVWDLDETFWGGTLSEGGIVWRPEVAEIVVRLAERGILSAICSKNDFATVRTVLSGHGMWDRFVFPSVDWTAKGPRIAELIAAIGLRPASILFIDDNPLNRAEARHFTPELQVASETVIPHLLDHPLLRGKDDRDLTRFAQYKLLERRARDAAATGDTRAFLRASGIKVSIEHDIAGHEARVLELVNRTNQLNFTKIRMADGDLAASHLSDYRWQLGLIRVVDEYGDYGFVGFYAFDILTHLLTHFCFSCRILGMGVERWLYERLGRPAIRVVGEVLADLNDPGDIDWITLQTPGAIGAAPISRDRWLGRVFLRGGCNLTAIGHYLSLAATEVVGEYNLARHGRLLRYDHSVFLRQAIEGTNAAEDEALAAIGYPAHERASRFEEMRGAADVFVLSFWIDNWYGLYRHRRLGTVVPFMVPRMINWQDATALSDERLAVCLTDPESLAWGRALREDFEFIGRVGRERFQANLRTALDRIDPSRLVILVLGARPTPVPGEKLVDLNGEQNNWTRELAREYPHVRLIDTDDFVTGPHEMQDPLHLDRKVYWRLSQEVMRLADEHARVST